MSSSETSVLTNATTVATIKRGLILFCHGSPDPEWARPFVTLRELVAAQSPDVAVMLAYLAPAQPDFEAVVAQLAAAGVNEVVVTPVFFARGSHVKKDLPQLVSDATERHGIQFRVLPTIGESEPMLAAIDQMQRKRNPKFDGYPPIGYVQSWTNAMMATKAIELTVDAGKPLTGDNLADALRGLKNWDTGGIFGVPVSVTGQKIGVGRIYRWNAKAAWTPEPVSDWLVSA